MDTVIEKLIEQLNSSVFVLLAILLITFFLLWKVSGFVATWRERHKHQDDRLCKVEAMHDIVIELKTKVDLIYENTNPRALMRTRSPISLTDLGQQISDNIKAEDIFAKYKEGLINAVEERKPANAYDIQTEAFNIIKEQMMNRLNSEELSKMKNEAYNNGILIEDIVRLFGIYLRDEILRIRNLPISDVDKHQK